MKTRGIIDFSFTLPHHLPRAEQPKRNADVGIRAGAKLHGGKRWESGNVIFGGPAKKESRNYWLQREGAVDVLVPNVTRFGEKNKTTEEQGWEDVPPGSALEGLLLPQPPGKDYRLLKIVSASARAQPRRIRLPASATTARR